MDNLKKDKIKSTLEKTKLSEELENIRKNLDHDNLVIMKQNQLLQERDEIIKDFLNEDDKLIPKHYLDSLVHNEKIEVISSFCMKKKDILEAIDKFLLEEFLSEEEKFDLCCSFAMKLLESKDKHRGVSFLNNARYFLSSGNNENSYKKLIELSMKLNSEDLAIDFQMELNSEYGLFSEKINKKMFEKYKKMRSISEKSIQHGHGLLIDYIEENIENESSKSRVLVEIGTTRENIPGQGSTLQLAELCKRKNIKFITVDMDGHNTRWINFISKKLNLNVIAITKKGEDFLRDDIKEFDFIFLDAYDFDHGGHSELRQTRYEQNLGSKIDEKACHLMHLDCAKSIMLKLKKDGVVCVDDTWKDEKGKWIAKGALAVPYFLKNNFKIIKEKNNAILLKRGRILEKRGRKK